MSTKSVTLITLGWLSLAILSPATPAKTLTVGQPNTPCPNAEYGTIAAAVTAAAAGDVVAICPALYAEQLIITKPLTLLGISVNGVNRVLVQPSPMTDLANLPFEAVVTVMNTTDVTIQNLVIDASHNTVTGCDISLSAIHYFNSSGAVNYSAITGAQLQDPTSCPGVFGNGYGVLADSDGSLPGPFQISVFHNSIHDYTKQGIFINGKNVMADLNGNSISGIGPGVGTLQFGIFLFNASGRVTNNMINEGLCGSLSQSDCINLRSEGVVLRAAGDGTVVDGNTITNAQSGIFINGGNKQRITNNVIRNIEGLDGIDIQGTASGFYTSSLIEGNTISSTGPLANFSCGIFESTGTGVSGNRIANNTVSDAYCGVGHVTADHVEAGTYFNTLYSTLNTDLNPSNPPPPVEPSAAPAEAPAIVLSINGQMQTLPLAQTNALQQFNKFVNLDASKSTGGALTFQWSGTPPVGLTPSQTASAITIQFPNRGYASTITLTVTNSAGQSSTATIPMVYLGE